MLESDDLSTYFWDSDSDAKNSDLDSNPEDSDSDLAHNRPVMLSHITCALRRYVFWCFLNSLLI